MITAPISEIFFSYQGEGILAGEPQIFIRFSGCNLNCNYCDTKTTNPPFLSVDTVIGTIKQIMPALRCLTLSISLTGGEPLLYIDFLKDLLPQLKKLRFKKSFPKIYLETNGTLPENYLKISKFIDTIAMDIKLPSDTGRYLWKQHAAFLKRTSKKVFVKIILTSKTKESEIRKAVNIIKKIDPKIPLIFQPSTPNKKCKTVSPENLYRWTSFARKNLKYVSITPQLHKLIWRIK